MGVPRRSIWSQFSAVLDKRPFCVGYIDVRAFRGIQSWAFMSCSTSPGHGVRGVGNDFMIAFDPASPSSKCAGIEKIAHQDLLPLRIPVAVSGRAVGRSVTTRHAKRRRMNDSMMARHRYAVP